MSEKRWGVYLGDVLFDTWETPEDAAFVAKEFDEVEQPASFIEVEIRPLHQEPCKWELQYVFGGYATKDHPAGITNLAFSMTQGRKYCPECGRRL